VQRHDFRQRFSRVGNSLATALINEHLDQLGQR